MDVVDLYVDLNEIFVGLIDVVVLKLMKMDVYFINVLCGLVIVIDDFVVVLKVGEIVGCVFDMVEGENVLFN